MSLDINIVYHLSLAFNQIEFVQPQLDSSFDAKDTLVGEEYKFPMLIEKAEGKKHTLSK